MPDRFDRRDSVTLTSALTGFEVQFADGIRAADVSDKAMPPISGIQGGAKGAWRAHMNTLREIVAKGYGSALIAESDVDWDIRLKVQLADFALASTGILSQYSPDHVPRYAKSKGEHVDFDDLSAWLLANQDRIKVADSPYGDGWDVLWLGNCNVRTDARKEEWETLSIIKRGDPTTPPVNQYWSLDQDSDRGIAYRHYANQTRLYLSQPTDQVCTIAYAVSQEGARKILLELGLERISQEYDLSLGELCQGNLGGLDGPAVQLACFGVMPSIFSSHWPAGPESRDSNIADHGSKFRDVGISLNLQRSVRINARKILAGLSHEIIDQYPYTDGTF